MVGEFASELPPCDTSGVPAKFGRFDQIAMLARAARAELVPSQVGCWYAYTVMAYIVMAYIVMGCIIIGYIVMAELVPSLVGCWFSTTH